MAKNTKNNPDKQPFLALVHELGRAYQAYSRYDLAGYRDSGLTQPQAQVIFSLGNTRGLTSRELGELSLISKGTLTGVIDRLQARGLVERVAHDSDRRCTLIRLTPLGNQVYATWYPRWLQHLNQRFDFLGKKERKQAIAILKRLRELFE